MEEFVPSVGSIVQSQLSVQMSDSLLLHVSSSIEHAQPCDPSSSIVRQPGMKLAWSLHLASQSAVKKELGSAAHDSASFAQSHS